MAKTMYVFIDESGDLGSNGASYFTIAALVTEQPTQVTRIIKRYRQRKLKKSIKQLPEIKANNSGDGAKRYILNGLASVDCELYCYVVEKELFRHSMHKDKDKFYNKVCAELVCLLDDSMGKLVIAVDKKHTNKKLIRDFDRHILSSVTLRRDLASVEIVHMNSCDSAAIQVVDFVAWAVQRKFTMGDDMFFQMIEDKINNRSEMLYGKK